MSAWALRVSGRLPLPLRIEAQEVLIVDGLVRQASPLKRFGPRSLMKAS